MMSNHESPPWNRNVKMIVAVAALALLVLGVYQFRSLVRYLVIAGIIAYLFNPIINLLANQTPLKRTHSILVVYLGVLAALLYGLVVLGVAGFNQINALRQDFPTIVENVLTYVQNTAEQGVEIGPFALALPAGEWEGVIDEAVRLASESWTSLLQRSDDVLGGVFGVTFSTLSLIGNLFLIYIFSIYISFDLPRFGSLAGDVAHSPGYRQDAERLTRSFGRIWRAYLRGQITLALAMWLIVWITLSIMGVNNAFALGLVSGLMEFLPLIGAIIGAIAAVLVALFQPENWMGLSGWQLALLVAIVMIVIQQIENNILVPRIVGGALDLHPLVTMVAVIMGASIAGILGAILAAPITASLKLLAMYGWRKMFDQDPFPEPENLLDSAETSLLTRLQTRVMQLTSGRKSS